MVARLAAHPLQIQPHPSASQPWGGLALSIPQSGQRFPRVLGVRREAAWSPIASQTVTATPGGDPTEAQVLAQQACTTPDSAFLRSARWANTPGPPERLSTSDRPPTWGSAPGTFTHC